MSVDDGLTAPRSEWVGLVGVVALWKAWSLYGLSGFATTTLLMLAGLLVVGYFRGDGL